MGQLDASIVTIASRPCSGASTPALGSVTWVGLSYLLVLVAAGHRGGPVRRHGRAASCSTSTASSSSSSARRCAAWPRTWRLSSASGRSRRSGRRCSRPTASPSSPWRAAGQAGRGIGIQGAAQAVGLALGPSVGGFLFAAGGWRLIFLSTCPSAVRHGPGLLLVPRSRHLQRPRASTGPASPCSSRPSARCSRVTSSPTPGQGVAGSPACSPPPPSRSPSCAGTEGALADLTSLSSAAARSPPASPAGSSYVVLFGTLFVPVPFYLERGLGPSVRRGSGLLPLGVMPVALGVTALLAGRLAERLGARPLTVAGMAVTAASMGALVAVHGSPATIVVELAVLGAGLGLFTPPNNVVIMGPPFPGSSPDWPVACSTRRGGSGRRWAWRSPR